MNRMIQSNVNHSWKNYLFLFIGVFLIAWSAILVKSANVSGFASGFYRMFFGLIGTLPLWLKFGKPIRNKKAVMIAIICGALFASDIAMWNTSIMLTKASVSTLLANLAPVWVGLGSMIFLKNHPGKIFWGGTTLALFGITIVVGWDNLLHLKMGPGNALAIGASLFYASYQLTVKNARDTLDTFSFTFISVLTSTVVLGLICLWTQTPITGFPKESWIYLALLGFFPQVFGWLSINQAMGHLPPTIVTVSLLLQPVLTAVFSVPVLGEYLSITELFGGLLVLTGILLVNLRK